MEINDVSPERRNLMITSMAFVIFYAGGAYPSDETIRLLVINLTFSRPQVLGLVAWGMLFWFCIRFWQKHGVSFWKSLKSEINKLDVIPPQIKNHVIPLAVEQLLKKGTTDYEYKKIMASRIVVSRKHLAVACNVINSSGAITSQEIVNLMGVKGWLFSFRIIIVQCIRGNALSDYLIPYILFLLAVSAPLWSKYIEKLA